MSKKLISQLRWKRYLAQRQRAFQRKRRVRPHRIPLARRTPSGRQITMALPSVFSLVKAPDEATAFFARLWNAAGQCRIRLDLSAVNEITSDAVTALVAAVRSFKGVSGNAPEDVAAREMLVESGFFEHVRARPAPPRATQGRLRPKKSQKVEPELADQLIAIGRAAIQADPGPRHGAYRALIECMSNTHNHAGRSETVRETWWCSVYGSRPRGRICYTFLDTGIGIFKSVRVRKWKQIFGGNLATLRGILERRIPSSTGEPYRGKGLPAIYESLLAHRIERLVIIANDVYADVAQSDFRKLDHPVRGTLLYWETT